MKILALFITVLALIVVSLGAYVRLSNAGLGCPDWPGCYGHATVPEEHQIGSGQLPYTPQNSDRPLQAHKAWKEMIHRYLAGSLATLILLQAILALIKKTKTRLLSLLLLGLVFFQAALGMWTVTLKLHPVVVMLHLVGGLATLSISWLIYLKFNFNGVIARSEATKQSRTWLQGVVLIGLTLLILQIILGGWVSSNYASLACPDFPTCQGKWLPETDFHHGFSVFAEIGHDYEGGWLTNPARISIHLAHRVGALINFLYSGILMLYFILLRQDFRKTSLAVLLLLFIQVGLGISNILLRLPLSIAVAHNTVAALLLLSYLFLWKKSSLRLTPVRQNLI